MHTIRSKHILIILHQALRK